MPHHIPDELSVADARKEVHEASTPTSPTSPTSQERRGSAFISFFSSFLGPKNPLAHPADPHKQTVWLLDNTAYQPVNDETDENQLCWHAEVVACIFETEGRKDVGNLVAAIADHIGLDGEMGGDDEARRRIAERVQPFLNHVSPARTVTLQVPISRPGQSHGLGPSDRNGLVSQTVDMGEVGMYDGAVVRPRLLDFGDEAVSMSTTFAEPEGWLVVSDIDDTIKHTMTLEPTGIIRTTFADIPEPVAGMPELYRYIHDELFPAWFYLSASPYNLYPFLHDFLDEHYYPGTLVLRDYSWMDITGIIKSFTEDTQEYKVDRMEKIRRWFPRRRVLCIGDSTQKDPEAYAEMYSRYPEWIHAIIIRKVKDVAHMEEKNKPERFEKAFEYVPSHIWTVFDDPGELYDFVDGLDPNDSLQSDIPPTQPIVEHGPPKDTAEHSPGSQKVKRPSEPSKHTSEVTRGTSEAKKPTSHAAQPTSSTLNDSPFTPLSMRALYYTPDRSETDIPDGIPEGETSDVISPDTSTSIVRSKGTNLVFDAGFPTPQPSPGQYLLKIATAAFCHDEIRLAELLNPPITTPQIPLHSLCGTVISTPREDDKREKGPKFKIGDVVFGVMSYKRDGGAADYAVATESELALKPDNITVAGAAALALPALTAWQALFRYAGLDPDVPGGLNEDDDEFGSGGIGVGRWLWQRQRRDTVLGGKDYGYGHRKSTVGGAGSGNGGLLNDTASGGSGTGNGRWVWQWNRGGDSTLNANANGNDADIDRIPPASRAVNPEANPKNVRRDSLISLVSGNPSGKKTIPRAASTVDPNPKGTVRRNSLIGLIKGNTNAPATRAARTVDPATSADANGNTRRGSLVNLVTGNSNSGRRASLLGSIIGITDSNGSGKQKLPNIRVLVTNARDNDIGRIAVQILRADSLFPFPVRPWICVTCTQVEADIIEKDWEVDEIVIIPHLPSADECNIEKVFRARRWQPVDIVLDCAGGEVFRAAHAAGVVKDYGAVLTVVDGQVAQQSPLVPEKDLLGEKKRGIKSRFVPVNPDGPAMERIAELVEESLVCGREVTVVDLAHAADLLAAGAAGTAGSRRGGMVVVRVNSVAPT
ncbi:unnamed protein product [Penicillium glandicola]